MSGEAEPRRSVRATKGQHTKSFDELEHATAPKRRQTKKTKKAKEQEQEQEDEEEEIIRCVCGATEQDEDSGEAWIACETCGAWQHNVCVGVSSYDDEIPEHYWCEQCRPQDHKELLDGIAKGEKPWEARRKVHEEEAEKKRKKGGRKGKGKRTSDARDDVEKISVKSKQSPAPDLAKEKKETAPKQGKRKNREDSHDTDGKSQTPKIRRVSENEAAPALASYAPPPDLAQSVTELPSTRSGPAKALLKAISHTLSAMQKQETLKLEEGSTVESKSEAYALQVERAVFDTHPATKAQKEYNQQIKSLSFNLKNNPELCNGLVAGTLSPSNLAVMSSEQMASSEMQRQTAEMKARAEKQAIFYTSETGLRVRRTHKGEEVVEDETFINSDAPPPLPAGPRRGAGREQHHVKNESTSSDRVDLATQFQSAEGHGHHRSPSNPNFDITKVFSSVKSPTPGQHRRPSAPLNIPSGPGVDADVDRMLQDETESPPYSPTEEMQDPEVIWRGSLAMSSIADFQATAKHIGGANFAQVGPWSKLIPKRMAVAGRIPEQSAIEYLCSLRYSSLTDVIVINIVPASPASQMEFNALIDYFVSKKRYGVVGDKVVGNVRDTYLVPVPAGDDNHPEFMLNLLDNKIPKTRTEPMLLAVFVYRNDPEQLKQMKETSGLGKTLSTQGTPSEPPSRSNSLAGPAFSPATPQGAFPPLPFNGHVQSQTPVPIPQPPHYRPQPPAANPPQVQQQQPQQQPHPPAQHPAEMDEAQRYQAQQVGQALAQEVLGPLVTAPTVQFLMPQAYQMTRKEWETVKSIYVKDPRSRDDLVYLGKLIDRESEKKDAEERARLEAGART